MTMTPRARVVGVALAIALTFASACGGGSSDSYEAELLGSLGDINDLLGSQRKK